MECQQQALRLSLLQEIALAHNSSDVQIEAKGDKDDTRDRRQVYKVHLSNSLASVYGVYATERRDICIGYKQTNNSYPAI